MEFIVEGEPQGKAKKSKAIAKAWLSYEPSSYVRQR